MTRSDGGTNAATPREETVMSADTSEDPMFPDEVPQPEDPFEPEAPAHADPDEETIVHDEDLDDEAVVDEVEPEPEQPI
jgi:hypothetical protein